MNWYKILGVEEGATLKEIKKYHPDLSDNTLNDHMGMTHFNRAYKDWADAADLRPDCVGAGAGRAAAKIVEKMTPLYAKILKSFHN